MLFNSLTFVVFFAVVLAAYWTLRSWETRKNLLLVASYVFYGAWNPPFALLLFATTALDFYLGSRIARAATPGQSFRRATRVTPPALRTRATHLAADDELRFLAWLRRGRRGHDLTGSLQATREFRSWLFGFSITLNTAED
jgi:hypothetical protein